jgi:hypothetical protein
MIRKSVQRSSEKIMRKTRIQSAMRIHPDLIALWPSTSARQHGNLRQQKLPEET